MKTRSEILPHFLCDNYRVLAEMRAFRLSGYAVPAKPCLATDEQITEIEKSLGDGKINWNQADQPRIVDAVIRKLISEM